MEEKLYQNIDALQNNPLDTIEAKDIKPSEKKPLNPKVLLLIILGSIVFVLLLLSLIVTQVRKNKPNLPVATPTTIPVVAIPTNSDSLIPSPYQQAFKEIDQSLNQDPDLPVPQIDTTIGN